MEIIFEHWRMPDHHQFLLNPVRVAAEVIETMSAMHLGLKPPHNAVTSVQIKCINNLQEVHVYFMHFDREILRLRWYLPDLDAEEWVLEQDFITMLQLAECRLNVYYKDEIKDPNQMEINYEEPGGAVCRII